MRTTVGGFLVTLACALTGACGGGHSTGDAGRSPDAGVDGRVADPMEPLDGATRPDSMATAGDADAGRPRNTCPSPLPTRVRFAEPSVPFGEVCEVEVQTRACDDGQLAEWDGDYRETRCHVAAPRDCDGASHGTSQARTRYQSESVPAGQACLAETQTRSCTDGSWSQWSGSYTHEACAPAQLAACDGQPSGTLQSRLLYMAAEVSADARCEQELQTRRCEDGEWTRWSGTATAETCVVRGRDSCGDVPHGAHEQRTFYAQATVEYGAQCEAELRRRRCSDGRWGEWDGSYTHESCEVAAPSACEGTPHGASVNRVRFEAPSVPFGASCRAETQTWTCDNGQWSRFSGTFTEESCRVEPPADCEGGAHGSVQTRIRYLSPHPADGIDCAPEAQTRICHDGSWSEWSGSYEHLDCVQCQDGDGDGFGPYCHRGEDCDDDDPSVHPQAGQRDWDATDTDCDGVPGRHLRVSAEATWAGLGEPLGVHDGHVLFVKDEVMRTYALADMQTPVYEGPAPTGPEQWRGGVLLARLNRGDDWQVFDFADPTRAPVLRSTLHFDGPMSLILSEEGDRVYAESGSSSPPHRIEIWGLEDLSDPERLGEIALDCDPSGIVAYDGLLIFGSCKDRDWTRPQIFDVSDPSVVDRNVVVFSTRWSRWGTWPRLFGVFQGSVYAVLPGYGGRLARLSLTRGETLELGEPEVSESLFIGGGDDFWRMMPVRDRFVYVVVKEDAETQPLCVIDPPSLEPSCFEVAPAGESHVGWAIGAGEDVVVYRHDFARHVRVPADGPPTLGKRLSRPALRLPFIESDASEVLLGTQNGVTSFNAQTVQVEDMWPHVETTRCAAAYGDLVYTLSYLRGLLTVIDRRTGEILLRRWGYEGVGDCGVVEVGGQAYWYSVEGGGHREPAELIVRTLDAAGLPSTGLPALRAHQPRILSVAPDGDRLLVSIETEADRTGGLASWRPGEDDLTVWPLQLGRAPRIGPHEGEGQLWITDLRGGWHIDLDTQAAGERVVDERLGDAACMVEGQLLHTPDYGDHGLLVVESEGVRPIEVDGLSEETVFDCQSLPDGGLVLRQGSKLVRLDVVTP